MRTTLSIDDDVLAAAKGMADRQNKTIGEIISELARRSLQPAVTGKSKRNGIPLLPVRENAGVVTLEIVNQLREELN